MSGSTRTASQYGWLCGFYLLASADIEYHITRIYQINQRSPCDGEILTRGDPSTSAVKVGFTDQPIELLRAGIWRQALHQLVSPWHVWGNWGSAGAVLVSYLFLRGMSESSPSKTVLILAAESSMQIAQSRSGCSRRLK